MPLHRPRLYLCSFLAAVLPALTFTTHSMADVWVVEPSAAIDQRIDDNYTIDRKNPDKTVATRVVGTFGLSREAPSAKFSGLARVDALVTNSDSRGGELDSNRVAFLSSQFTSARSEYGIGLNYKVDTPSRDISADLTDISSVAADTGASVTQGDNVARERYVLSPNFRYNLTRRTTFETELTYTSVTHELTSAFDARQAQFLTVQENNPNVEERLPLTDDLAILQQETGVFTIPDELDNFQEAVIDIGFKSKLSPITTISFFAGYSDFTAKVEPDQRVTPFEDKIEAADDRQVLRDPKRKRRSNTAKFRIGYDRAFTPTLNVGVQVGIYTNETDETDLLRITDIDHLRLVSPNEYSGDAGLDRLQGEIDKLVVKSSGYLANITATKSTGITRYSARFGVDVLPSDIGSQVESLEAVGDLFRQLGPLLDFSFRVRAYEPDVLSAARDDEFARRFLSLEPKLIWRFSRAWTVAGSYRYRRQKSHADPDSGESNALLFSLKYTPPSAIRDAELGK